METPTVLGDAVKSKDADVIVTKVPQARALQHPTMDTTHTNIRVEVRTSLYCSNGHYISIKSSIKSIISQIIFFKSI